MSGEDAARVATLEREMAAHAEAVEGLRQGEKGLRERAEQLAAQIDAAGGERLKRQRDLVASLQQVCWCMEGTGGRMQTDR
jgi:hypothetical protein